MVIVVVDMQNDFAHPEGSLYVPSTKRIIPVIKSIVEWAHGKDMPIVYTQDWHRKDDPSFRENGGIWKTHCIQNSWGAKIVEEFEIGESDFIIQKQTFDAFFDTPLDWWLRQKSIKELLFCGTVSNICVLESLSGAAKRGYKVGIIEDACAALDDMGQKILIHQVKNVYMGKIIKTSNLLEV